MFHPYPTDLPTDAIKYLAGLFLKRETFDKATLGNAVYAVQGFLQSFLLGVPGETSPPIPARAEADCTVDADEITAQRVADAFTNLLPKEQRPKDPNQVQQGLLGGIGTTLLFMALQRLLKSLLSGVDGADSIVDDVIDYLKELVKG